MIPNKPLIWLNTSREMVLSFKELKEDVGNYKKGDLVVDMAQAKRGYANHILY